MVINIWKEEHLELNNSIVAREYSIKGINSRIDLAVLENKDIIELRSNVHI